MKTINELTEYYESELKDILRFYKTNLITEITNVRDRSEAETIRSFLINLKKLKPNELQGVSNNEQKEKINCVNCGSEVKIHFCTSHCLNVYHQNN